MSFGQEVKQKSPLSRKQLLKQNSPKIMLYGDITSRGLIPASSLIFVDEWLSFQCE